jgi:3-oxoadipate enol-lactonase
MRVAGRAPTVRAPDGGAGRGARVAPGRRYAAARAMTTRFVRRMAVEISGDGDPVLLLHGLGGTSNTWTPLAAAFVRHRTIRPDLPGSGRSCAVEGALSIARLVEFACLACDEASAERVHVVGHSLGTIVALHLAASQPARIRSLALFGPLACPPDGARPALRARAAKARSDGVGGMQEIADALAATSVSRDAHERRAVAVAAMRESVMRQDPDGYARLCEALADAQAPDLAAIACPALLATGDEDVVAPPQSVRALGDRIRESQVRVVSRCGHWTPFERPDECVELLRSFYSRRWH